MAYEISITQEAEDDLAEWRVVDRKRISESILTQFTHQAEVESRHRKRLRENPIASWELRVDDFRVFYNVDGETVTVTIVGVGRK
jgi:mRNA-degrading endonuclease RelE of RelBE toxin-antitoxin system